MSVPVRGQNCYDRTVMGHTPNRVDRLLIRTATAARAGMATTADISTRVHPANGRGKRITGSRCHHQHQPWSTPLTDQPILTAHNRQYALPGIGGRTPRGVLDAGIDLPTTATSPTPDRRWPVPCAAGSPLGRLMARGRCAYLKVHLGL